MDRSWTTLPVSLVAGFGIGGHNQIQHTLKLKGATHQSEREAFEDQYKVVTLLVYALHIIYALPFILLGAIML